MYLKQVLRLETTTSCTCKTEKNWRNIHGIVSIVNLLRVLNCLLFCFSTFSFVLYSSDRVKD